MNPRQATVDALIAERYGPATWWPTPVKTAAEMDAARKRRELLDVGDTDSEDT